MTSQSPNSGGDRLVLVMLEGAFRGRGWQGPTLTGALRGVSPADAAWRPGPGRKCIWDHALHAAYWKHNVASILAQALGPVGVDAGRAARPRINVAPDADEDLDTADHFPRSPANWPTLPTPTAAHWKNDRQLLADMHERLLAVARRLDPDRLGSKPAAKYKWTIAQYLAGAAAHDMYHCGQIQLIKRLRRG